jgi:hypothetical protein
MVQAISKADLASILCNITALAADVQSAPQFVPDGLDWLLSGFCDILILPEVDTNGRCEYPIPSATFALLTDARHVLQIKSFYYQTPSNEPLYRRMTPQSTTTTALPSLNHPTAAISDPSVPPEPRPRNNESPQSELMFVPHIEPALWFSAVMANTDLA